MQNTIINHIPINSYSFVQQLIESENLVIKVKSERKTRHGDYKMLTNGGHQITINSNLNQYRFLITLIHEVAHLKAYKDFGRFIKPHGKEWKYTFQHLMLPFLNPDIFPNELLPILAYHFKNPKASSDTDLQLALALKSYDQQNGKNYIFEVPLGHSFKLYNGRVFKKGKKRTKRYECVEVKTGKLYLFNPNAEIERLD